MRLLGDTYDRGSRFLVSAEHIDNNRSCLLKCIYLPFFSKKYRNTDLQDSADSMIFKISLPVV